MESKLHNIKLENNSSEQKLIKTISHLEKLNAVQEEKILNYELKLNEIQDKQKKELEYLIKNNNQYNKEHLENKQKLDREINFYKENLDKSESKYYDLQAQFEKEKLLSANKLKFLENNIECLKSNLNEINDKNELNIKSLQIKYKNELDKIENSYKLIIENIEKNNVNKINENAKVKDLEISHLNNLISELEKQVSIKNDNINKLKNNNVNNNDICSIEYYNNNLESIKNLNNIIKEKNINVYQYINYLDNTIKNNTEEYDRSKKSYNNTINELNNKINIEKDNLNKKKTDFDRKLNEFETCKNLMILKFENEKGALIDNINKLEEKLNETEKELNELKLKQISYTFVAKDKEKSKGKSRIPLYNNINMNNMHNSLSLGNSSSNLRESNFKDSNIKTSSKLKMNLKDFIKSNNKEYDNKDEYNINLDDL